MVDGLGDSWQAVTVTLDVGQLLTGQASAMSYVAALCIAAMTALAGLIALKLRCKLQCARWDREQLADAHAQAMMERKVLRLLLRGSRYGGDMARDTSEASWTPASVAGLEGLHASLHIADRAPEKALERNAFGPSRESVENPPAEGNLDGLEPMVEASVQKCSKPSRKPPATSKSRLRDVAYVSQWANDQIAARPGETVQAMPLYQEFSVWCNDDGVTPISNALFGIIMGDLGYAKEKRGGHIHYLDIGLKSQPPALKVVAAD